MDAGNVEWQDSNKTRCLVMWRSPQEWGKLIYQWVSETHTNFYCYMQAYHTCIVRIVSTHNCLKKPQTSYQSKARCIISAEGALKCGQTLYIVHCAPDV